MWNNFDELRFKRNGSFCIREGWIEKAFNEINKSNGKNVFSKKLGVMLLGIGSNMVSSLRYWMHASGLLERGKKDTVLSSRGQLLSFFDPYLEDQFSWWLIHYWIVTSTSNDAPVFTSFFFDFKEKQFVSESLIGFLCNLYSQRGIDVDRSYIENDVSVLCRSYTNLDSSELLPEEKNICPLSRLGLLQKQGEKMFVKSAPSYVNLDYRMVYFAIQQYCEEKVTKGFVIDDLIDSIDSPCKVFNLDRNLFLSYLDDMRKKGLITLYRTAGLNTVHFEKNVPLQDLLSDYFEGKNNV